MFVNMYLIKNQRAKCLTGSGICGIIHLPEHSGDTMNKSRLLLIIVCLFLVHTQLVTASGGGTLPLTPPAKVSPTETNQNIIFLKEFNILALALAMYYLEAEERLSNDGLKERLGETLDRWEDKFNVTFDLDSIGRHGFVRDYPFTVRGKSFIIRLFDEMDAHHAARRLPDDVKILYQGKFKEGIGFQILPGINDILGEIEPILLQTPERVTSP
jgi:hypothetical protein